LLHRLAKQEPRRLGVNHGSQRKIRFIEPPYRFSVHTQSSGCISFPARAPESIFRTRSQDDASKAWNFTIGWEKISADTVPGWLLQ